jgi:adenylylsulfate kinase-like enzyme
MIFTGQGAQYAGMGQELFQYAVFRQTMQRVNDVFAKLGCKWSIFGKLVYISFISPYDDPINIARRMIMDDNLITSTRHKS